MFPLLPQVGACGRELHLSLARSVLLTYFDLGKMLNWWQHLWRNVNSVFLMGKMPISLLSFLIFTMRANKRHGSVSIYKALECLSDYCLLTSACQAFRFWVSDSSEVMGAVDLKKWDILLTSVFISTGPFSNMSQNNPILDINKLHNQNEGIAFWLLVWAILFDDSYIKA